MTHAPRVTAYADALLQRVGFLKNPYFCSLTDGSMSLAEFRATQEQFYFAVCYYARPIAALVCRIPEPIRRLDLLHNIVEEHGDFREDQFHQNTFRQFLASIGGRSLDLAGVPMGAAVHAFNCTLIGACTHEEIEVGVCCLGIIERAFADVSSLIGKAVVKRGWVSAADLVHYALHAELDVRHADDFFGMVEARWDEPRAGRRSSGDWNWERMRSINSTAVCRGNGNRPMRDSHAPPLRAFLHEWRLKLGLGLVLWVIYWTGYFLIERHLWRAPIQFVQLPIDRWIGFWPQWVWGYQSIFFLLPIPFLAISRNDIARYGIGFVLIMLAAFSCFILFPIQGPRPAWAPTSGMYGLVTRYDLPLNNFPSLHLAVATYSASVAIHISRGNLRRVFMIILPAWVLLIGYSALATKQHFAIDLPPGILLGWAARRVAWVGTPSA